MKPTRDCIKVNELRKKYGSTYDFRQWLSKENNYYVGRKGRIFITTKTGKEIFHYPASCFENPFKVNENCSLEESLQKYKRHLYENQFQNYLHLLENKNLGCWCLPTQNCHVDVLIEFFEENYKI